jgi:hypothetical protein
MVGSRGALAGSGADAGGTLAAGDAGAVVPVLPQATTVTTVSNHASGDLANDAKAGGVEARDGETGDVETGSVHASGDVAIGATLGPLPDSSVPDAIIGAGTGAALGGAVPNEHERRSGSRWSTDSRGCMRRPWRERLRFSTDHESVEAPSRCGGGALFM